MHTDIRTDVNQTKQKPRELPITLLFFVKLVLLASNKPLYAIRYTQIRRIPFILLLQITDAN